MKRSILSAVYCQTNTDTGARKFYFKDKIVIKICGKNQNVDWDIRAFDTGSIVEFFNNVKPTNSNIRKFIAKNLIDSYLNQADEVVQ